MRSSLSIGVTACELSFRAQCIKGNYCGANKGNLTISRWHTQSSVFSVAISEEYFGAKRILISRSPLHESSTPLPAKTIAVHEKYMEVLAIARDLDFMLNECSFLCSIIFKICFMLQESKYGA